MRYVIAGLLVAVVTSTASPAQPAQRVSTRAAWDALNSGRIQEAADAFAEALTSRPQDASLLLGAGVTAHLQGRPDDARRWLFEALKVDPALTPASLLLGAVLYGMQDIDGAIGVYEQALTRAPDHAQITGQLEAWRKEAALHRGFGQRLGDHFTVLFEGPAEAALAASAVKILESAYWRIGTALYTYPADVVTVVLYTREQFRDITQSPEWAGGAFDGRIRVPVQGALQNPREFERVLSHEFTHALVRSLAPRGVPFWLDEGLAVNFEGSDITRRAEVVRKADARLQLPRLERSFADLSPKEASLAYAESAVAVQTLLSQAGAPALVSLIEGVGRGEAFDAAFEKHILVSYAEFQKKLQSGQSHQ